MVCLSSLEILTLILASFRVAVVMGKFSSEEDVCVWQPAVQSILSVLCVILPHETQEACQFGREMEVGPSHRDSLS